MHELQMSQVVVDSVLAELEALGPSPRRLIRTRVVVGYLRPLVPETLQEAYRILTEGTPAANSVLEVRKAPFVCRCQRCQATTPVEGFSFACSACGSASGVVVGGREFYLESLEVEEDEPKGN
ncbi:MAG: hydrogenase maturation nickel metallochaperone HypA [Planctomycetota bacterium]